MSGEGFATQHRARKVLLSGFRFLLVDRDRGGFYRVALYRPSASTAGRALVKAARGPKGETARSRLAKGEQMELSTGRDLDVWQALAKAFGDERVPSYSAEVREVVEYLGLVGVPSHGQGVPA